MNRFETVRLVAMRELTERIRSRAIQITSVAMPLLVVLLIVIPALVRQPAKPTVVGLVGAPAQALGSDIKVAAKTAHLTVRLKDIPDEAQARAALKSGTIDAALSIRGGAAVAMVRGSVGYFKTQTLAPALQAVWQATLDAVHERQVLLGAGVPPATLRAALTPVPLSVQPLAPLPKDQAARDVAALAAAMLLYISLGLYGNAVVAGVAQEKTSRMGEILVSTVRATDLLVGKVVGIGVFGVAQMAVTVGAGLLANSLVQNTVIPSTVWILLPTVLVWFVLGYVLYAFAYAVAGTLVGRPEDVQNVAAPFIILLVGGFLLTYLTMADPTNVWLQALSFLPPLAPILMPARLAISSVAPWEMPVAAILTLAAAYGEVRLAARIYAPALVQSGGRMTWRSALSLRRP